MQNAHGFFPLAGCNRRHDAKRIGNCLVDAFAFRDGRVSEHISDYLGLVAGMADADSQPPECIAPRRAIQ